MKNLNKIVLILFSLTLFSCKKDMSKYLVIPDYLSEAPQETTTDDQSEDFMKEEQKTPVYKEAPTPEAIIDNTPDVIFKTWTQKDSYYGTPAELETTYYNDFILLKENSKICFASNKDFGLYLSFGEEYSLKYSEGRFVYYYLGYKDQDAQITYILLFKSAVDFKQLDKGHILNPLVKENLVGTGYFNIQDIDKDGSYEYIFALDNLHNEYAGTYKNVYIVKKHGTSYQILLDFSTKAQGPYEGYYVTDLAFNAGNSKTDIYISRSNGSIAIYSINKDTKKYGINKDTYYISRSYNSNDEKYIIDGQKFIFNRYGVYLNYQGINYPVVIYEKGFYDSANGYNYTTSFNIKKTKCYNLTQLHSVVVQLTLDDPDSNNSLDTFYLISYANGDYRAVNLSLTNTEETLYYSYNRSLYHSEFDYKYVTNNHYFIIKTCLNGDDDICKSAWCRYTDNLSGTDYKKDTLSYINSDEVPVYKTNNTSEEPIGYFNKGDYIKLNSNMFGEDSLTVFARGVTTSLSGYVEKGI